MRKNRWILIPALLCAAFLVSCGKRNVTSEEMGELVIIEKEISVEEKV